MSTLPSQNQGDEKGTMTSKIQTLKQHPPLRGTGGSDEEEVPPAYFFDDDDSENDPGFSLSNDAKRSILSKPKKSKAKKAKGDIYSIDEAPSPEPHPLRHTLPGKNKRKRTTSTRRRLADPEADAEDMSPDERPKRRATAAKPQPYAADKPFPAVTMASDSGRSSFAKTATTLTEAKPRAGAPRRHPAVQPPVALPQTFPWITRTAAPNSTSQRGTEGNTETEAGMDTVPECPVAKNRVSPTTPTTAPGSLLESPFGQSRRLLSRPVPLTGPGTKLETAVTPPTLHPTTLPNRGPSVQQVLEGGP